MASRRVAILVGFALLEACAGQRTATPDAGGDADAGADADADGALVCEPADADRGQCRRPVEASFCAATWSGRPAAPCGLRVYQGPGAGYLLQYVSFVDVPPLGGPSWLCIYDQTTQALVGVWALDHYLRWCCESSLDLFEGVASDELATVAYTLATHPPCPDAGAPGD